MNSPAEVILNPGDFCFAGEGTRIRTLLGSCVSITLWHPRHRIGGACHYMMACRSGMPCRPVPVKDRDLDGRYAEEAVELFLRHVNRHGTRPREYEVKMFGGGNQFEGAGGAQNLDVPRNNVAAGLRLLGQHGFVLSDSHVGGYGYRRLTFDLSTGAVDLTHVHGRSEKSVA